MTVVDAPHGDPVVVDVLTSSTTKEKRPEKSSRRSRRRARRPHPALARTLFIAGLVLLVSSVWFLCYAFVLSGLQERGSQARLYDEYRLQLAEETAPLAAPIKAGSPVAMLNAPSGHMHNLVVVEGTTSQSLVHGPGHMSDTPLPGQTGNPVILGRSVTYGAPFGHITSMKVGDVLTVTTGQGKFTYTVEDIRHPGQSLPPLLKSGQSRLTLVTSESNGWKSGWAPTHTVYLDAMLTHGHAQPVPSGVPTAVSRASLPMQGGSGAVVPLIFWLEGLVVVAVAIGWSWVRWGRLQTWVVGVPVFLLALWGSTDALMCFLPNLL